MSSMFRYELVIQANYYIDLLPINTVKKSFILNFHVCRWHRGPKHYEDLSLFSAYVNSVDHVYLK